MYVAIALVECGEDITSSDTLSVYRIYRTTESMQEVVLTFSQPFRNAVAAGRDYGGLQIKVRLRLSSQVLDERAASSGGSCGRRGTSRRDT